MKLDRLDELGQRMANAALRALIDLCPEIRHASAAAQDAVCAAMRSSVPQAVDDLLGDARLSPCLAEAAFQNAVLSLALAGIRVLRPDRALKDQLK